MAFAAKVVLVLVTILCLLSIGGAMFVAAPVLVPLHALAARRANGPTTAGGWVFLAASSSFEWSWMAVYAATEAAGLAFAVGGVVTLAVIAVLLVDTARRTAPLA